MPSLPSDRWPGLLTTLAKVGPFDALLVAEVDREWVRVVRVSEGVEELRGLTVSTRLTAWGDLEDGVPTLCRGLAQRYPEDTLAQRLQAQSVAALAIPDVAPARVVLLAVGKTRWQKPKPRLERMVSLADVVAARLLAERDVPLEEIVRVFEQAGPEDDALYEGLRILTRVTEARWALLVDALDDDPAMGQPVYFLDEGGADGPARPSTLPVLPLSAVRARWTGTPPAAAAWLPGGGRAASASGRELRARDGKSLGAVAVYHDDPLAWTAARERALDLFAVLASAEHAHRRLLQRGPTLPPPARVPDMDGPPGGIPVDGARIPPPPEASGALLPPGLGPRAFEADVAVRSIAELLRPGLPDDVLLVVDAEGSVPAVKVDPSRFQRAITGMFAAAIDLPGVRRVRVVAGKRSLADRDQVDLLAASPKTLERAVESGEAFAAVSVVAEGPGLAEETEAQAAAEDAMGELAIGARGLLLARREAGRSRTVELLLPPVRGTAAGSTAATATGLAAVRTRMGAAAPDAHRTMQVFRAPAESSALRRPLVLVVDDEAGVRKTLTRLLARSGARCVVAADGLEALETVRTRGSEIDLVFLDVRMPSMGGMAALKAIKAASPSIPVVLMSGYEPSEDEREVAGNVAQGFLSKPFRLDAVRQLVSGLTGGRDRSGATGAAG